MKTENQYKIYKANINKLIALYPNLFNKEFPLPLAIGIDKLLKPQLGLSCRQISAVLRCWTNRKEYQFMLCSVYGRYHIDGLFSELRTEHSVSERTLKFVRNQKLGDVIEFMKAFEKRYRHSAFQLLTPYQKQQMEFEE